MITENLLWSFSSFFQFLLLFPPDLSDRVVVPPSKRFRHTSYSFCSDTRWVSIDVEVIVLIDAGLLVSFDGICWGKILRYWIFLDTRQDPGLWVPARRHPSPRYVVLRVWSLGLPASPGKGKLPIRRTFHISEYGRGTYFNRLRPALRRLYKGNLYPRTRHRHFET